MIFGREYVLLLWLLSALGVSFFSLLGSCFTLTEAWGAGHSEHRLLWVVLASGPSLVVYGLELPGLQGRGRDWWRSVSIDGWTFWVGRKSQEEAECPPSTAAEVWFKQSPFPIRSIFGSPVKGGLLRLTDTNLVYNYVNSPVSTMFLPFAVKFFKLWNCCRLTE